MKLIDATWVKNAVAGGTILGGGGGGSPVRGKEFADLALRIGSPALSELEELNESDTILTVSAVGAPSIGLDIPPADYVKAVNLMLDTLSTKPEALMPNEVGGFAVVNGLLQSAILGIPVVNAACNGRAHPTGLMGAMGLSDAKEDMIQEAAVGGRYGTFDYLELLIRASLPTAARVVRQASETVGGIVAVARTPVNAAYARTHAAVGALSFAESIGAAYFAGGQGWARIEGVLGAFGGKVVQTGIVEQFELSVREGFDVGKAWVEDCELTFWNEYMTLEKNGSRIATFPDLIMTMDANNGNPIPSSDLRNAQEVTIISAPKESLILGAGMRNPDLFRPVEKAVQKEIIEYVFGGTRH